MVKISKKNNFKINFSKVYLIIYLILKINLIVIISNNNSLNSI